MPPQPSCLCGRAAKVVTSRGAKLDLCLACAAQPELIDAVQRRVARAVKRARAKLALAAEGPRVAESTRESYRAACYLADLIADEILFPGAAAHD